MPTITPQCKKRKNNDDQAYVELLLEEFERIKKEETPQLNLHLNLKAQLQMLAQKTFNTKDGSFGFHKLNLTNLQKNLQIYKQPHKSTKNLTNLQTTSQKMYVLQCY